jgi:hypothetical protein
MISVVILIVLAAVSVRARRIINAAAMFIVCAIVWTMMVLAMPLESPRRAWRLAGVAALVVVLVAGWKIAVLTAAVLRHLP